MTSETVAAALPFLCLVAAIFRAPLAALPLAPPCALIAARVLEIVDTSSASHPARWLAPMASMSLALGVMWLSVQPWRRYSPSLAVIGRQPPIDDAKVARAFFAALIAFAASGPSMLALLAWQLPGTWILIPFQIGVSLAFLGVLLAPERWLSRG